MAYTPGVVPQSEDVGEVKKWVEEELRALQVALLAAVESVPILPLYVEPPRPRDGMVVYADGTQWDPGSGEGFYGRENGAWVKL